LVLLDQGFNNSQLLKVLLPEHGAAGMCEIKKSGYHQTHALKKVRAKAIFQAWCYGDIRKWGAPASLIVGIDDLAWWREECIGARIRSCLAVVFERSWI
jgi:hypothetical protein